MKKNLLICVVSLGTLMANAQENPYNGRVGINTETPMATLEIAGKPTDKNVVDGVIIPKLTADELIAKSDIYTTKQRGTLVYVTSAPTIPQYNEDDPQPVIPDNPKNRYVNEEGYYYYNGEYWEPLNPQIIKNKAGGYSTRFREKNPQNYNNQNVGLGSFDLSINTEESSEWNGAIGIYSFVAGNKNTTSSSYSATFGRENKNNGYGALVAGTNNIATGSNSVVFGHKNTLSSPNSFVAGTENEVSYVNSFVAGKNNKALYPNSFAFGENNLNYSYSGSMFGRGLISYSPVSFTIGYSNEIETNYSQNDTQPKNRLFVIGNGTKANRSNALTVWASGFYKWQMHDLPSYTHAVVNRWGVNMEKGMHSADNDGVMNTWDGEKWKKYIAVSFSSSAPTNAKQGDMYFDITQKKYFAFDGDEWKAMW